MALAARSTEALAGVLAPALTNYVPQNRKELVMGLIEFMNLQGSLTGEAHFDGYDEPEGHVQKLPGIPESSRIGWESAWIDIGGEG
jgi:hypothetical protein